MLIKKENLKTLWYEDINGNRISSESKDDLAVPKGAIFQVSQFPNSLRTTHLQLIRQEDVDKCKHPRRFIKPTYGWIKGIVGRKCTLCHGTQTKNKWHLWGKKWNGYGSRKIVAFNSGWNEELVLAIVNSGDYTLSEAIIISATACERCMNALAYKYGLDWGYKEGSEEWKKCGTSCDFCKD